jgi:hypothetical protein
MAMDAFIVFAASYDTLGAAEADYHAVREFYQTSGLIDTYDAAVITRDDAGKVKIVVKHEQPTRQGAWRGLGIGLVGGALVGVAASDIGDRVEHVIRRASKLTRKPLMADQKAVQEDIEAAAAAGPDQGHHQAVAESQAAVREAEAEVEAAERAAAQYSTFRPPPGGDDVVTRLGDLARLREAGVLSPDEFEAAKAKLLSG